MIKELLIPSWRVTQETMVLRPGSLDLYFAFIEASARKLGVEVPEQGPVAIYLKAEIERYMLLVGLTYKDRVFKTSDVIIASSDSNGRNEISLSTDNISPYGFGSYLKAGDGIDILHYYNPNAAYINLITQTINNLNAMGAMKISEPFCRVLPT